ncbi:uncharacterized protein LOC132300464 isoform X4 [Cornus florida]|uniref:uncharacterized protein LOC132300464 isoform X4 n=1 Tax=Cornus florida TaxID=4283 RepID=UPI0028A089C9|nr:uncharacterized protein LOC132300464 isoform X4 [Cornus florida]XP_059653524.1 uncharacterized protein LOC132300464 isoform X4 [Cornus florida]XP_059653525.1 uncharacterized protein LOC132300464 isoform X4 [Cornus florida]
MVRGLQKPPVWLWSYTTINSCPNLNLEFVRVVGANSQLVSGIMWYITFEATDAGVKNTYQAKVYSSIQKKWTLYLCRLAPQIPLVKKGDGDEPGEEDPNSSSNAFGGYIFY